MSHPESTLLDTDTEYYYEGEGEEEGEEVEEEEEIYYNSDDFISNYFLGENSTIPGNIFEFDHSYGYDCRRYYNLAVADEETVIFASGNYIHFFNTTTRAIWFRRSAFGGGIGFIAKNPQFPHIAVAENTTNPPIIIYDWPSFEIVCLLKGGSTKRFMSLNYTPDGLLLVSQAGAPDYLITIWNWVKKRILLRSKCHVQDVFRAMFSPFLPGQLASCGASHIKFWKMATTFTGLKLQGELGRFGKTEYTDIIGILPLEDEKVVSGCSWGNILLWEGGLIKIEVLRRGRIHCHDAPVVQFFHMNGEIYSVAMDGHVKLWYYPQIDQADPPDTDRVVEMEPSFDLHVPNLMYMWVEKQNDDPNCCLYYAQDGNGGIWRVDLRVESPEPPLPPEQLYFTHGGPVMDLAPCPYGPYLATLGLDGKLNLYAYLKKTLIFTHKFPAKGNRMMWLPINIEPSGEQLILAFDDGCLRVVVLQISEEPEEKSTTLDIIQFTKPHTSTITQMLMNSDGSNLITGGEDKTIFIYQMSNSKHSYGVLTPIGYINAPDSVTYLTWHLTEENTVIVGCLHGQIMQVEIPTEPQEYTTITYILDVEPKYQRFTTYKAQIRRDIKIAEIEAKKAAKMERKMAELEKVRKENPGLEIDEEVFLADSSSEEVLEPLHIPDVPNRIIWIQHTEEGSFWLSMGGYDAGYIYEYYIDQKDQIPYRFQIIHDGDDIEIENFIYNSSKEYLILAMQDGAIRVNRVNPNDWRDLSDYWQLPMHDNFNGRVTRMAFSYDEKYFFSCGYDGNIFAYKFYPEEDNYISEIPRKAFLSKIITSTVTDKARYDLLSLEQAIVKKEQDRVAALANERKKVLKDRLKTLKVEFYDLLERNKNLLPSQIIPRSELEISPKITKQVDGAFQAKVDLVKRKLAFRVEKSKVGMRKMIEYFIEPLDFIPITVAGINTGKFVKTLRQRKLTKAHYELHKITDKKILEEERRGRPIQRPVVLAEKVKPTKTVKEKILEYFLAGLSPSTIQLRLGAKLTRLLGKYRARKAKWEKRKQEWDLFNFKKPSPDVNPPDDEKELEHAEATIGDVPLKTSPTYKLPKEKQTTTLKKFKEMLNMKERIGKETRSQYRIRYDFNKKVYDLRSKKVEVRDSIQLFHTKLNQLNREIPVSERRQGIPIPRVTDEDFPEKHLEVRAYKIKTPRRRDWEKVEEKLELPQWEILEKEALPNMESNEDEATGSTLEIRRFPEFYLSFFDKIPYEKVRETANLDYYTLLNQSSEEVESPWEIEMRNTRMVRKFYQQERILATMREMVENFDADLEDLATERLFVVYDADIIDLHLLTLYQELIILKNSEDTEHELMDKANVKINEYFDIRDSIIRINNRLGRQKSEVTQLELMQRDLTHEFFSNVTTENKFYSFLRRIFKRKYKPPKIKDPDESSSSSSSSESSESEEDEAASVDSKDFGIIRLDENVCPKGCDKALYDLTFNLRNKRWDVEQKLMVLHDGIAVTNKEIDDANKKLKVAQTKMNQAKEELEMYLREKQKKLNAVTCVAIMKFHQLQHLTKEDPKIKISETVIFDKNVVTRMYKRVGQLHQETLQQQAKRKVNITHLTRMKTDCKFMEEHIKNLKKEGTELMEIKFGKEVNINELEEAMLRKMVLELRMSWTDIRNVYEHELGTWRDKLARKQEQLAEIINSNSGRLELLAALNKEKTELSRFLVHQPRRQAHLESVADIAGNYKADLTKLNSIIKSQKEHLKELEQEIKRLKTKGLETLPEKPKKWMEDICIQIEEEESLIDFEEFLRRHPRPPSPRRVFEDEGRLSDEEGAEEEEVPQELVVATTPSREVRVIISEMLEKMDIQLDLVSIIDEIWIKAMERTTVAEIVDDIIDSLPIPISEENLELVENAAEKLYSLQEPEISEEDLMVCAQETILEVIEEVAVIDGEPHHIIAEIITELVIEVPAKYLKSEENLSLIKDKITGCVPLDAVDFEKLRQELLMLPSSSSIMREEIKTVLNDILEAVFGRGIDLMYVIRDSCEPCDK